MILITSPDLRSLSNIANTLQHEPFTFAYLGQNIGECEHIHGILNRSGRPVSTKHSINRVANDIRDSYLAYIADIGQNEEELGWWSSHLSYKSCYISKVFQRLCLVKMGLDIAEATDDRQNLVLIVPDKSIRWTIRRNLSSPREAILMSESRVLPKILRESIDLGVMLGHRLYFLLRESSRVFFAKRAIRNPYIPEIPSTCIVSSLTFRNATLNTDFHKSFFGDLEESLSSLGLHTIVMPIVQRSVRYKDTLNNLITSDKPIMILHRYLSYKDIIVAAFETRGKPPPKSVKLFKSMDIKMLIEEERTSSWISNWAADASLFVMFINRVASKNALIDRFIYVFENQPWERALCWSTRKYLINTKLVGYQHSRTPRLLLNFHTTSDGEINSPLPHYIVAVGSYTANILQENGYKDTCVRLGGALQMQRLLSMEQNVSIKKKPDMILIGCSNGSEEAAELVYTAIKVFGDLDMNVVIKCHPIMPFERFEALIGQSLPNNIRVSDSPIQELMVDSSFMVYSGSTVCIEALGLGLPMIHLIPKCDLDLDPLESVSRVRLEAYGLDEMVKQSEWLLENREQYIEENRLFWNETFKKMYEPVTEQTPYAFL